MREGIYIEKTASGLHTGFIIHFNKGLQVTTFTSCTMAFVIVHALAQPSNRHLHTLDAGTYLLPIFECAPHTDWQVTA